MDELKQYCQSHSGMVEKLANIERQVSRLDDVFKAIVDLRLDITEHKTKVAGEAKSTARIWSGIITILGLVISFFYKVN